MAATSAATGGPYSLIQVGMSPEAAKLQCLYMRTLSTFQSIQNVDDFCVSTLNFEKYFTVMISGVANRAQRPTCTELLSVRALRCVQM